MKQIRLNQGNSLGCVIPLLVAPLVGSFLESTMDTKYCRGCKTEKPVDEFYKDKTKTDGLCSRCKGCRRVYHGDYHAEHSEERNAYSRAYYASHQEYHKAYRKEHAVQHPERIKATNAVNNAIISGKLIRPDRCSNPRCNKLCKPEGHHWSYLEKHWLDPVWGCKNCHKLIHATGQGEVRNINWYLINPKNDRQGGGLPKGNLLLKGVRQ